MGRVTQPPVQGIVPGEILTLAEFCRRAGLSRDAWSSMLRRATVSGATISYVKGKRVFLDTAAWIAFLKEGRKHGSAK